MSFSIRVYKQYFNFAAAHFLIFPDGTREPLHGHNYRVSVRGEAQELKDDMVIDFLNIKPLVREICNTLDHKLILPQSHGYLERRDLEDHWMLEFPRSAYLVVPKAETLLLDIPNSSAECLARYLCLELKQAVRRTYGFTFKTLEVEVEETPGQSATYLLSGEGDPQ